LRARTSRAALVAALVIITLNSVPGLAQEAAPYSGPPREGIDFIVVDGDTLVVAAPLEILGAVVPAALPGLKRSLEMLDAADLEALPGRSVAEKLQTVPGVVVSQRQQYGVQGDLSIRGSSFEQVQMLLDGYDISDPQTGHHVLDLPVGRGDIRTLEVLPGHGSVMYGSGSFGGTVNARTFQPADTTGLEASLLGGGQGTWGSRMAADIVRDENNAARFSFENFRTDGRDLELADGSTITGGTDADTWSGTGRLVHRYDGGDADIQMGMAERDFGALGFYAPYASRERTETVFGAARVNHRVRDGFHLEPRVYFRRHTDLFVLLRENPAAYTNDHLTRKVGSAVRGIVDLPGRNTLSVGVEGVYEDIDSQGIRGGVQREALGRHLRRRVAVAAELDNNDGPAMWQLGVRLDSREGFAPRLALTGALSYAATEHVNLRGSIGTVNRVPTFTELYYVSPTDVGDAGLEVETGYTWDLGAELNRGRWRARTTFFQRVEDDLIEWARPTGSDAPWRSMNIADARVRGLESLISWRHGGGHLLAVGHAWLEKELALSGAYEGKYALLTPRQQIQLQGTLMLPADLGLTLTGRYLERTDGPADFRYFFVMDGRLDWEGYRNLFASLVATNLLDRRYEEIPGVPMSGFLLTGRVGVRF